MRHSARFLILVSIALAGCGPITRKPDAVPADQIPPGFTAADCHWETVKPSEPAHGVDPISGPRMQAAPDREAEPARVVACRRPAEHIQKCVDANGDEKPMSLCNAPRP